MRPASSALGNRLRAWATRSASIGWLWSVTLTLNSVVRAGLAELRCCRVGRWSGSHDNKIFAGVGDEGAPAPGAAEVVALTGVVNDMRGGRWIDGHGTHWVDGGRPFARHLDVVTGCRWALRKRGGSVVSRCLQ